MNNIMTFGDYRAVISYDDDIDMFRGEFVGLNGGADFYASNIDDLRKEGAISLKVFLDACCESGITPKKPYSGRFNIRIAPDIHEKAVVAARAEHKSLNQWVADAIMSQY